MIPSWTNGILPPIKPGMSGHSRERSPYSVTMSEVVEKFAFSKKRQIILQGLLNYRKNLYETKIVEGFQWIDGSFMEDIETLENRDPNDIDVITFFHLPVNLEQKALYAQHRYLFENDLMKEKFHIDGYIFPLGEKIESRHVRQISYWYSMWSHRRDGLWKGFLKVDLSPTDDEIAANILKQKVQYESR